jgi:Carboxypeptidase regulatory-like domain
MRSSKKWALFQFAFLALFAIAFLLSPSSANAQLSAGSVTGIVRDSSGSVVADASVTLRNLDTTIEHKTVSNDAGNYVFLNLGPGRYALEATAPGFATKRVAEFVLAVNQTASIDISLQVGSQSEVVTISAETEQLDVSTADLGTVIATKQVNDLPLNGRNFTQLLSLTPGVAPVSVAQNAMGGRAGGFGAPISVGSAFIFPAVNGQTNRSNFFLTDGLNNFGSFQSTYSVPPIVDAIQEFKVVSHTDSAQFGSVLGGVVNVVTKSGTNEYHGTGWEYVRNTAFDARNTFLQKVTPFRQNQFGASFGGPVWIPKLYNGRNKTFFYFAYQGFRYTQDSDSLLKVPTAAQLAGDESSFPTQIYNPFSTRPDPANPGKFIRDPFPGNQIPSNLIDSRMVAFAKGVLPPAGPILDSSGDNAIDTTPNHQTQNEYNVRIDQNFGQKNSLFFRYSAINSLLNTSGGLPGLVKHGSIPGRNWGASYVHTFNSSLVLQVQYARTTNQDNSATLFTNPPANLDSTVGFSSTFVGGFAAAGGRSLIPNPQISGYASGGENITNVPKATDSHQVSGNLTKIVRNHTLTFGGGFTTNKFESPLSYASLSFAAGQTGNPQNPNQPGDPLASFLLNVPDGANRRNVHETTRPGGLMSLYIQDSWKATSKLAFNFGLRYDRTFIPPYGTNATIGQQGGIETGDVDFSNGTYIVQKLPPPCTVRGFAPCIPGNGALPAHVVVDPSGKIAHDTLTNFGPRVGFAYRLGNRTVLRGAAGIVYDNWAAVSQMAQNIEGAWPDIGQLIANNLNQPSTTSATPTTNSQDPFAGGGSGLFPAPTPFNQVQWFYDPHIKNPYSMQWNFGVQRELNSSTTVDVNYVGSGSRRLNVGGYYNTALTPGPGDPQARAPFPYIAPTFYDRSIGNGSYNALQVEVNKRYSNGLAYQVAYTYSKSIDEGSSGWFGVEGQSLTDPYNVAGSRGPSGFDLRHTLSVNMLYQIPVGHGRYSTNNRVLDYVIGNWQINNIFTARSGVPFNVYYGASDLANTGNVSWAQYDRANLVGDPHSGSCPNGSPVGSVNCIFNTSAFAVPAQYTFGNSGRDAFRSPSFWNLDTSIFRQFPFWGEGRRIEFRAEAFNIFNTVILGTPGNDISNLSSFGKANNTANSSRQLQLGAKIIF